MSSCRPKSARMLSAVPPCLRIASTLASELAASMSAIRTLAPSSASRPCTAASDTLSAACDDGRLAVQSCPLLTSVCEVIGSKSATLKIFQAVGGNLTQETVSGHRLGTPLSVNEGLFDRVAAPRGSIGDEAGKVQSGVNQAGVGVGLGKVAQLTVDDGVEHFGEKSQVVGALGDHFVEIV